MYRYIYLLFVVFLIQTQICAQEKNDLGILVGGSYYLGDYNLGVPLYQPSPAVGVVFKHNLNNFYTFRLSALYGGLKGHYNDQNLYLPSGNVNGFNKRLIELETLCEINFIAFDTRQYKKERFSPYFIVGLGGANVGNQILFHLPFGIGLKVNSGNRTAVGFEWRMHKTLSDKIDGYQNPSDNSKAFLHNNDWFSFAGVFLTYRLFNYNYTCPAYR